MTDEAQAVVFRKNGVGELTARMGNLEIGFYPDDGCFIVVFGIETGTPCSYTDSECPEDKARDLRTCAVADNCPFLLTGEIAEDFTTFYNEGDRAALTAKLRHMLLTGDDGLGHPQTWPEPAASRFGKAQWIFEDKTRH